MNLTPASVRRSSTPTTCRPCPRNAQPSLTMSPNFVRQNRSMTHVKLKPGPGHVSTPYGDDRQTCNGGFIGMEKVGRFPCRYLPGYPVFKLKLTYYSRFRELFATNKKEQVSEGLWVVAPNFQRPARSLPCCPPNPCRGRLDGNLPNYHIDHVLSCSRESKFRRPRILIILGGAAEHAIVCRQLETTEGIDFIPAAGAVTALRTVLPTAPAQGDVFCRLNPSRQCWSRTHCRSSILLQVAPLVSADLIGHAFAEQ